MGGPGREEYLIAGDGRVVRVGCERSESELVGGGAFELSSRGLRMGVEGTEESYLEVLF